MHLTPHALDRFQEHHPEAPWHMALSYMRYGTEISPELAMTLTCRRKPDHTSKYKISHDFQGLFVINPVRGTVITYLRLPIDRVAWLTKEFGQDAGVAA